MFLNDAYDSDFDRIYRKERPIPSGAISEGKVWGWGLGWLLAGLLLLSLLGGSTLWLAVLLASCVLVYDAVHKAITLSPLLMAACRFLLYLLAASTGVRGINGLVIWCGLALAAYVVGLSYIARKESARGPVRFWPVLLLLVPVVMAGVVNAGAFLLPALVSAGLLLAWIVRCLGDTFWSSTVSVGRTVSGLLAGICLVDLVALAGGSVLTATAFSLCFFAALLGQRYIPAT
jgi:4-hydroxybenzoate polyprenyltransferase